MNKDMYRVNKNKSGIEMVLDTEFEYLVPILFVENDGTMGLWGKDLDGKMVRAAYQVPKWLADGVRELMEKGHKCTLPDMIIWDGWECPDCGQCWGPEEIEPGGFSWTKEEDF